METENSLFNNLLSVRALPFHYFQRLVLSTSLCHSVCFCLYLLALLACLCWFCFVCSVLHHLVDPPILLCFSRSLVYLYLSFFLSLLPSLSICLFVVLCVLFLRCRSSCFPFSFWSDRGRGRTFFHPGPNRTSEVYKFFWIAELKKKVICLRCKRVLVGINTSNCSTHLTSMHNSPFFPDIQAFLCSNDEKHEEQKEDKATPCMSFFFRYLMFLSLFVVRFYPSCIGACSIPPLWGPDCKRGRRNRHSSRFSAKSLPYNKLVLKLTQFIVCDKRSLRIVDGFGLINFVCDESCGSVPSHDLMPNSCSFPSARTALWCWFGFDCFQKVVPQCYQSVLTVVRSKLKSRGTELSRSVYHVDNSIALTSDLWTDPMLRIFYLLDWFLYWRKLALSFHFSEYIQLHQPSHWREFSGVAPWCFE